MNETPNRKAVEIVSVNKGNRFNDLTGNKFGELIAESFAGRSVNQTAYWNCVCSCGESKIVAASNLLRGLSKSCGTCKRCKDISEKKFGRLTVIKILPQRTKSSGGAIWECLCECGKTTNVPEACLSRGATKSCGCLHREIVSNSPTGFKVTHGMTGSCETAIWNTMKQRCGNPNNHKYADYGGRGISVCNRWLNSFENFISDMGPRPSKKHSIGRKDNDGNYEPSNCKWETAQEQAGNKRNNVIICIHGEKMSVPNAAIKYGVSGRIIKERINRYGWTHERAVGLI